MAAESFVLAMFTINDRPEGYERMTAALLEIDSCLGGLKKTENACQSGSYLKQWPENPDIDGYRLAAAWDGSKEEVLLEESEGRFAGEFVNLYPPGVPLLVPGERITGELCQRIRVWLQQGLTVQGIVKQEERHLVKVLKS